MSTARQEKIASRRRRDMSREARQFASAHAFAFRGELSAHLADVANGCETAVRLAKRDCQTRGYVPAFCRTGGR